MEWSWGKESLEQYVSTYNDESIIIYSEGNTICVSRGEIDSLVLAIRDGKVYLDNKKFAEDEIEQRRRIK